MLYDYEFAIRINKRCKLDRFLLTLLSNMDFFFIIVMNEDEFANFRYNLELQGIELHEITRTPHFDAETVV